MQEHQDQILSQLDAIKVKGSIWLDLSNFSRNFETQAFNAFSNPQKGVVGRVWAAWQQLEPEAQDCVSKTTDAEETPKITTMEGLKAHLRTLTPGGEVRVVHKWDGPTELDIGSVISGEYDHDISTYIDDEGNSYDIN